MKKQNNTNVKAVVFDWHGVLDRGHFSAVIKEAWRLYSQKNKGLKKWRFWMYGPKYNSLYKKYNKGTLEVEMFWKEVEKDFGAEVCLVFRKIVDEFQPLKKGLDLLAETAQDFKIYLLSDCPVDKKKVIEDVVEGLGLEFEDLFFSCDFGCMKNDGKLFKVFQEKTGLEPVNILFWDDNFLNVRQARKLGWKAKVFK